jgi:U3 small nucleolar RNA-associated protein 25
VDAEDINVVEEEINDLSSENEVPAQKVNAYAALMQSFGQVVQDEEPRRKKRKLAANGASDKRITSNGEAKELYSDEGIEPVVHQDQSLAEDLQEPGQDDEEESADEDEDAADAFDAHFAKPDDNELSRNLQEIIDKKWYSCSFLRNGNSKWTVLKPGAALVSEEYHENFPEPSSFQIKQKLSSQAKEVLGGLNDPEKGFAASTMSYKDTLFGKRTVPNSPKLRSIACLHALNHIFKTRDKVIKNNARLAKAGPDSVLEYRDQGFTRPKVLVLVPTRQSCVRYVNTIIDICKPEQQENKKRFEDSYVADEDMSTDKPGDYCELFAGNNDDMFRIGIKFTRKTMKFFSQFYNSDLIIASPLGVRQAISGKKADSDFLSSIEILVLDQADALLMQNWEHVTHIMEHLNQQPKEAHGCDFSRVRSWYLDGSAKYLRQTIMLSSYLTPQHISLFATHAQNTAGRAIYQPFHAGAILIPQALGIKQTFLRFPSPTLSNDPTARFKHFTSAILPSIAKMPRNPDGSGLGILIYVPDSLDFPKLRNHFSFHPSCVNISYGSLDENHAPATKEARRARSHFETGRHSVLLYTERAHHFFRHKLRGVKKVVFYGVPTNPIFYEEVGAFMEQEDVRDASIRCLFSKWERLALERVVGTKRVGKMVKEKGGDVFEFL